MGEHGTSEFGRRGTSPEADLRRKLFRVLRWSEQQEESGIATLTDAGLRVGDLLLSRGRVCLAIPGRDCPQKDKGLDSDLARLVKDALASGRFSATASAGGRGAVGRVRAALLRLVAADLSCMLGGAREETLSAELRPAQDDYAAALTFSASEVLVACLARTMGPLDGLSAGLLDDLECSSLLVMARGGDENEVPYPIAARGVAATPLMEMLRTARVAAALCGGTDAEDVELEATTMIEEDRVWHFVGGPRHLVAVAAERPLSHEALSRAIRVASGG